MSVLYCRQLNFFIYFSPFLIVWCFLDSQTVCLSVSLCLSLPFSLFVNYFAPMDSLSFFYTYDSKSIRDIDLGKPIFLYTVCPRNSDTFYIVSYYKKWVTTSWAYSIDLQVVLLPAPVRCHQDIVVVT